MLVSRTVAEKGLKMAHPRSSPNGVDESSPTDRIIALM